MAYLSNGKVIGLSKVARIVDVFAHRLQIQENLTTQIAKSLMRCLEPLGMAVVVEAKHLCMMMRGVEKQNSIMKTSCLLGTFKEDARTRSEFLSLLKDRLERVVLNAFTAGSVSGATNFCAIRHSATACAFGDGFGIVLRTSRSTCESTCSVFAASCF